MSNLFIWIYSGEEGAKLMKYFKGEQATEVWEPLHFPLSSGKLHIPESFILPVTCLNTCEPFLAEMWTSLMLNVASRLLIVCDAVLLNGNVATPIDFTSCVAALTLWHVALLNCGLL
jgi:hypothetical protein